MNAQPSNPYLKTKVMTASPTELRGMLLDGAVRFAEQGSEGLRQRDYEAAYNCLSRCQNILLELINALRPEHDPELCNRLAGLYTFLYKRLIEALHDKDPAKADEVVGLLRYEQETWSMVVQRLADENAAAATLAETPAATPAAPPPPGPAANLVGGAISVEG